MKVGQNKTHFEPVTIVLETKEELDILYSMMAFNIKIPTLMYKECVKYTEDNIFIFMAELRKNINLILK